MPEYSGYVDRSTVGATPTLDWNTVTTNVRDTLLKQEADREATRQKLAKDTQNTLNDLSQINAGQSQTGTEYITRASYQAKDLTNELYKQYTSGLMSKEQYNIAKQNISNTFTNVNNVMKGMQADYAKYMDLSQKGELSAYSDYMQGVKGSMVNLSDKTLYFEPTTGNGYIATLDKDKKVDKNTLMDSSWLNNTQNFFDPKVKTEEEVGKYTSKMKEFTKMLSGIAHPGVWTINDVRQRPEYTKLTSDISNAVMSTPLRTASVLTDFVTDKQYSFTRDEKEASKDPNKILLKPDANGRFIPILNKDQELVARKAVQRVIDSQLGVKEEQVEDTWHGWAPKEPAAPKEEKPKPVVPMTTDAKISSSLKDTSTGKFLPYQRFNMLVPVVDSSTGTVKTIKNFTIDPLTRNMDMTIETASIVNGTKQTAISTVSTKKGGVVKVADDEPGAILDIAELNNMVRFIKNPKTGKKLTNWNELYDEKQPEAKKQYLLNKGGKTQGSYTSKGGIEYTVE